MSCCPKSAATTAPATTAAPDPLSVPPLNGPEALAPPRVALPGGRVMVGTNDTLIPDDGEKPARMVRVAPFAMDTVTVTNRRFAAFVAATGWRTCAERLGWSFVFHLQLPKGGAYPRVQGTEWWARVDGADWAHPYGPESGLEGLDDHPVVHVSHRDARAFAAWVGGRLPSETEWEYAAQGGLGHVRYPWGDQEPDDTGFTPCNIWQGRFPVENTAQDGFLFTAPAQSFAPNGFGLYNMAGNVWEWTRDPFRVRALRKSARALAKAQAAEGPRFVIKGGSFLCHKTYCWRYRIAARTSNTEDSTTSHMGFRVAYDAA